MKQNKNKIQRGNKTVSPITKNVTKLPMSDTFVEFKRPRKKRKTKQEMKDLPVGNSDKMYFTTDTENAIIEYNKSDDMEVKNRVYESRIKYAFEKLVENVFNTFKFTYFPSGPLDTQKETLAHLVLNMHKYVEGRGKAYSYFSIVAKHYLIFHNNTNYKRFNQHVDIVDTPTESSVCLQTEDKHYRNEETREFIALMIEYWNKNIGKVFSKDRDLNIANAIIELFRHCDRIESFNKKALYLYIREISDCQTQQITKVLNKMKTYQHTITESYLNIGKLKQDSYSRI